MFAARPRDWRKRLHVAILMAWGGTDPPDHRLTAVANHVHAIGFDDAPFDRAHRGDVMVVGAIYTRRVLDGVLVGRVRQDGANATANLAQMLMESRWSEHVQLILLKGIALAGFNVVDVPALSHKTGLPVLVVTRKQPNVQAMRSALEALPGGARKWRRIEALGPMEPLAGVWVQRYALTSMEARRALRLFAGRGRIPEPLRSAHLIAGALSCGGSRARV